MNKPWIIAIGIPSADNSLIVNGLGLLGVGFHLANKVESGSLRSIGCG
jgi:hypothetical protein